jgi:8-oxo-dGTP pyrophosphatase MutT (NUDIX family)
VQREMREETGLEVQIDSLLLDEPSPSDSIYQRWKTYRCAILAGEASPGSEPEADYTDAYSFTEVGWFDLRDPAPWDTRLGADSSVAAWLQRFQAALGSGRQSVATRSCWLTSRPICSRLVGLG